MTDLDICERFTVIQEEGFQRRPMTGDPGGATNWGVTVATLSLYRQHPCTADDVWNLTQAEALEVFHVLYYNAVRADDLYSGLNLMISDHAFNAGPRGAGLALQTALGFQGDALDGWIGRDTITAVQNLDSTKRELFLTTVAEQMRKQYESFGDYAQFGQEWVGDPQASDSWRRLGRLGRRLRVATLMVSGATDFPLAP